MEAKEYNIDKLEKWGEGASSIVYKDPNDPSYVVKVFFPVISKENVYNEYKRAKEVEKIGILTPKVLDFIKVGNQYGVIYERVSRKKSISRACSDDFANAEEYMKMFAESCKKLHNTEAKSDYFLDAHKYYESLIDRATFLSDEEDKLLRKFLHSIPFKTTAVHGDMHMGNVLISDDKLYWIDLGQFSYGNPVFDLSALYFFTNIVSSSPFTQETFHLSREQMLICWKYFIKYYYENDSKEFLEKMNKELAPYSVFFLLFTKVELGIERHFKVHLANLLPLIKVLIK